ncbi:14133_t:CDS:10 [Funneliformis caledonium]|uniref:14133_t:CDS:1 n=1 Tax=Funneliformis caledonium TaxID=1117310 RepID=A0A9N9ANX9_9GLOM|nr:14133_t:CDS:10 [Funneliformis caledonium]
MYSSDNSLDFSLTFFLEISSYNSKLDEVSLVASILGGFIILYGLVSFFIKERLYLSEALVSVTMGIILGPNVLKLLNPMNWGPKDDITHDFLRIVIAVQVMFSGVALPKAYPVKEWKTLLILYLPVMTYMWAVSGLLIRWLIPNINLLEALAIAACITPTDPILANSVVKGRFAEKHVPPHVRNLLSAESASNDGLAYPFLYLTIYLMEESSVVKAFGLWFLYSWLYQVLLSCVIGIIAGYVARKLLYLAESHRLIDKESFLVFAIALALFLMGTVSMIGSNDLLACFTAGTAFTWDDWFRKETEEAHLQEVIDMLLNLAMYVGATIPWSEFNNVDTGITVWRLTLCAILILIFRRLPIIMALMRFMPAIKTYREAAFTGWFGPIGIGAIYYLTVIKQHYESDKTNILYVTVEPVVYFTVISSILVHGITIPLVKISKRINTRTLTTGTLNNQVSRLPVIRIGTELIFRPKADKEKIQSPEEASENDSPTTTIEIDSQAEAHRGESDMISSTRHEDIRNEKQREEEGEDWHHNLDIPQNIREKFKRKHANDQGKSGTFSSRYAIWDEGDSYIIENYDGEDIHVIPSAHSTSTQEQNRSYFFRRNTGSTNDSTQNSSYNQEHGRGSSKRDRGSPLEPSPQIRLESFREDDVESRESRKSNESNKSNKSAKN